MDPCRARAARPSRAATNCVPLWRDIGARTAARRLSLIATTYGGFDGGEVLEAVPARIQIMLDGIPAAAAAGDAGMANLVAQGEPERSRVPLAGLVAMIPEILRQLSSTLDAEASPLKGHPGQPTR